MPTLRAWLPPLAYMGAIFVLSSMHIEAPHLVFPMRDKLVHLVEYGVLGLLVARAASLTWPEKSTARRVAFTILVATAFGVSDELHQSLVPGRTAELLDVVADFVGASLGALAFTLWSQRRRSRAERSRAR